MSANRSAIDPSILLEAVKRVLIEKESKKSVSRALNIPRTNLLRYIAKIGSSIPDITTATDDDLLDILDATRTRGNPSIFSSDQERALMEYVLKCADLYYGLSITEVRKLAFQFAKKNNIPYPETWNANLMAGEKWFRLFVQRHPNMPPEYVTDMSSVASVGPLQYKEPRAKSNRGRKSMETAILTSPEQVSNLRDRAIKPQQNADKKAAKKAKPKTPAKPKPKLSSPQKKLTPAKNKNVTTSSSSPSETDFCIICMLPMPSKLTKNNSIACNTCKREVHLKCANIKTSYFTCIYCDSEYSEDEEA